jgi:hypothetical protein
VNASSQARGGAFLAAVASRTTGWLLEPPVTRPHAAGPPPDLRPVIAVIALAPGCGTTTVARALAVELARRDDDARAAIVSTDAVRGPARVPAVATVAARRLARALPAGVATAAGRLCLIDEANAAVREIVAGRPAPVVLDVRHGEAPETALALADTALLVATPAVEPCLADVVAAALTRGDEAPVVVLNRAVELGAWADRTAFALPETRLGARLALAGRDPIAGLAGPIVELADALTLEGSL